MSSVTIKFRSPQGEIPGEPPNLAAQFAITLAMEALGGGDKPVLCEGTLAASSGERIHRAQPFEGVVLTVAVSRATMGVRVGIEINGGPSFEVESVAGPDCPILHDVLRAMPENAQSRLADRIGKAMIRDLLTSPERWAELQWGLVNYESARGQGGAADEDGRFPVSVLDETIPVGPQDQFLLHVNQLRGWALVLGRFGYERSEACHYEIEFICSGLQEGVAGTAVSSITESDGDSSVDSLGGRLSAERELEKARAVSDRFAHAFEVVRNSVGRSPE